MLFCKELHLLQAHTRDAFSPEVPYRQMKIAALFLEEKKPNVVWVFVLLLGFFLRKEMFLHGTVGIKEFSGICQMNLDDKPYCKTKCSSF